MPADLECFQAIHFQDPAIGMHPACFDAIENNRLAHFCAEPDRQRMRR